MTSWEFPGSDPIDIFINNIASGSVAVSAEPTEATTVNLKPGSPGRHDDEPVSGIHVSFSQGRLEITQERIGFLRSQGDVELTVKAPAGSRCTIGTASADVACVGDLGELNAKTASGDVTVASVSGSLEVTTASGDVWVENAGAGGRVNTASGDIRLSRAADDISLTSASGDVSIGTAVASVHAHTASGDVKIASVTTGLADVKTVSGDTSVGVAAGAGVYLDLSSLTGRIKSQLEETDGDDKADLQVTCRSVSGDIRIGRATATAAQ
jgi:DUF4097 and DUF4098 domain-containing protein YvlB